MGGVEPLAVGVPRIDHAQCCHVVHHRVVLCVAEVATAIIASVPSGEGGKVRSYKTFPLLHYIGFNKT